MITIRKETWARMLIIIGNRLPVEVVAALVTEKIGEEVYYIIRGCKFRANTVTVLTQWEVDCYERSPEISAETKKHSGGIKI